MIIFNLAGMVMLIVGFAIAIPLCSALGWSGEGPPMLIAGPLVALMDMVYRFRSREGHWFAPRSGGSLFFLPVWGFGLLWIIFGIVYTVANK